MLVCMTCVHTVLAAIVWSWTRWWVQEFLEDRHEELSRLETEIAEARAALEEHDAAIRQRAADLEAASEKLEAEEARVRAERDAAEQEAAATRALVTNASESERAAQQVWALCVTARSRCTGRHVA